MARTARVYERLVDAEETVSKLHSKYGDLFWAVRPERIAVMSISNCERGKKAKEKNPAYAKLRLVKGAEKALFEHAQIPTRYIIELYGDDWAAWSSSYRQCVLANVLLELTPEDEQRNKPDSVGFKVFLDAIGVNWDKDAATLPNLLAEDVEFNLELRPGMDLETEES